MSQKRRTFSREFKLAAVKKVVEQGLSCRQVACLRKKGRQKSAFVGEFRESARKSLPNL